MSSAKSDHPHTSFRQASLPPRGPLCSPSFTLRSMTPPKPLPRELQSPEKGDSRQQVGGGGGHSVAPVELQEWCPQSTPSPVPQHSCPFHSPPREPGSALITHLLLTQPTPAHSRGLDTPKLGRPQRGPPAFPRTSGDFFFFSFSLIFFFYLYFFCTLGAARRG